ncbi:SHOCT domain-containing protein [Prolixibacter sp. SD074]|uniref:SHOCT domain-containing protein n=1 Tax=Prolixibacter sp. SD074 TaxID=2652391 RepID=UPI001298F8D6|nr:SHOCT domain-containing protein [Prolixibacter sp. SD074]
MNDCFQFGWGWGWPFGWLIWFAFIILVVLFIVRLTRGRGPVSQPPRDTGHDSAMTILKERYARGEISREEYLERKKTLESD